MKLYQNLFFLLHYNIKYIKTINYNEYIIFHFLKKEKKMSHIKTLEDG